MLIAYFTNFLTMAISVSMSLSLFVSLSIRVIVPVHVLICVNFHKVLQILFPAWNYLIDSQGPYELARIVKMYLVGKGRVKSAGNLGPSPFKRDLSTDIIFSHIYLVGWCLSDVHILYSLTVTSMVLLGFLYSERKDSCKTEIVS
jgi:hypothetical protein